MSRKHFLGILLFLLTTWVVQAQETERQYLSGTGLGNTVTWQFRVSEGRNSGRWSKIEVPSQWELQGFGEYTYGRWYKKAGREEPFDGRRYIQTFFPRTPQLAGTEHTSLV